MATFRVRTPVPDYNGSVGSIHFHDGEATVEGTLAFVDGSPVLDENTSPVEFRHMVVSGYGIEQVPAPKKAAASKETTA